MTGGTPARAGLGLRARTGGAVAVAVGVEAGEPRVLLNSFLATGAEGDRLSLEPYRVAVELAPGGKGEAAADAAAAAVAEGRRRQDRLAAQGMRDIVGRLAGMGCGAVTAALLVNRAGWVTDQFSYSLEWPEHVPVAEGLAVRDALRSTFGLCGVAAVELDEKSLPDRAASALGRSPAGIEAQVKALGAIAGAPWRKDQKLACLAAWVAAAGQV